MWKFWSEIFTVALALFNPLNQISGKVERVANMEFKQPVNIKLDPIRVFFNPPAIIIADSIYFFPEARDVYPLVHGVKSDMDYTQEVYDCDDYSYWFKGELQRRWRKSGHWQPLPIIQVFAGIKINETGEIFYHAFNGIITRDGTVVWIEPQGKEGPSVMNPSKFTIVDLMLIAF
jgi:hypothetical protein